VPENPYRSWLPPVNIRCPNLVRRSYLLNASALLLAAGSCLCFSLTTVSGKPGAGLSTLPFVAASLLLSYAALLAVRARKPRRPRWALVWQAYSKVPVLVWMILDMDAPEFTYRARTAFRRTWWIPLTVIREITVSALGEQDTLTFGALAFSYRDIAGNWHPVQGPQGPQ
jgi:hypothetical protein